jgi:general secretion pathway protein B
MNRVCEASPEMSYILDALRKADAQRESDPARGIHAQPVRTVLADRDAGGHLRRWFWGASAASVAAVGATAWYLYHDKNAVAIAQTFSPPPQPYASMPAGAVPAPAPVNAATAGAAAAMQPPVTGSPPAPAVFPPAPPPVPTQAGPLANPRFGVQQPATGAGQQVAPVFPPQPSPLVPGAAQPMNSPAMPARPAPPPAAPAPPPPPVAGLPADAPKLVVSGGVYSADRNQRMLIVNGQVYKEGADLGSGVQLEQIKPNAAVLRFHGARYTTTY